MFTVRHVTNLYITGSFVRGRAIVISSGKPEFLSDVKVGNSVKAMEWTDPGGSGRLRLPYYQNVGTGSWYDCQPYAVVTLTCQQVFLVLISKSTLGPQCCLLMSSKNSSVTTRNRNRDLPVCSALSQPAAPPRAARNLFHVK